MTVSESIRVATERLAATSDTGRLDAELLMVHALGVPRSEMLLRHMNGDEPAGFAPLIDRRASFEPVAYIVGTQEFYGRSFRVTAEVLIPRSDSETTLEAMLDVAVADARVLDCGTGSGALLLSFLAERPEAAGVGIDVSAGAVAVARENAERLALAARANIEQGSWLGAGWADHLGTFDCIISNPPYVENGAVLAPDVRDHEPSAALFAGPDGLADYRALIPQLPNLLNPGGAVVLEIGADQADDVGAIGRAAGFTASLRRDLANRPRALVMAIAAA